MIEVDDNVSTPDEPVLEVTNSHLPQVSIVMAVHNDEEFVARSVESALLQSEKDIEVIVVDDASTDETVTVVERYAEDPRLKLIRLDSNRSAYQARRAGIDAARAPFVLFLDGDDELVPTAAETTLTKARQEAADVVGFGVEMVMPPGQGTPRFERSLQPKHAELHGDEIISKLFPVGHPAQGHLWKYLFRTSLLRHAYHDANDSVSFYRANDIPVSFLALAAAQRYVSTTKRLYRYYFRRGTSGQSIDSVEDFLFYLKAMDSFESIHDGVPEHAQRSYRSARRSMIGNLVRDCLERTIGPLQVECFDLLTSRVGEIDVILAAADFCREALPMLIERFDNLLVPTDRTAQSTVVTTSHLKTGGLQGVLAAQVHYMATSGINVTVALHQSDVIDHPILPDAAVAEIDGNSWAEKIQSLLEICIEVEADVVIDHHILYNEYWPFYALAAKTAGIGTIGWLHNFALRPIFNGSSRLSFLIANISVLETLVVLSPTDAAFWTLNGAENVVYLPNPPSPLLLERGVEPAEKSLGSSRIELVWWGRLQQSTKQVADLLEVAQHLQLLGVEYHLSIIGPDGPDLTRSELERKAARAGISHSVDVVGPLYGADLTSTIQRADVCLMTSAIEGYPLTLVEAQAAGLPVVMYEMPWLAYLAGNAGIKTVPQKDVREMAAEIANFVENPRVYARASADAVERARQVLDLDFGQLYRDLIEQRLSNEFMPEPSLEAYATLVRLSVEYSERTARRLNRVTSEVDSLKKKIASVPFQPPRSEIQLPGIENFQQYRKKRGSLMRRVLAKVLPSTWRQANFIAERSAKWNQSAITSLARQQQELTRTVRSLQDAVKASNAGDQEVERLLRQVIEAKNS
ncbi:glycosyltransferase [Brevibacterium casei]|uniref:glycosyltransferase n=1 Tax=Brevibacterium casei TaxID=33889 RepID=UPI0021A2B58F|nr:glycosyltransferase [Brevibacterium casei]MCT2360004.1 glycosyltransferase [Brevibacterium casei]